MACPKYENKEITRHTSVVILISRTDRSVQTAVWSGSTLFAILSGQTGRANSSVIRIYCVCHSVWTDRSVQTAVWSGSILFAILSGQSGRCKQQSDQDLPRSVQTAVWSGSTLFAILSGQTGWCKQQSDQDLPCLPFYLDRQVSADISLIRIYPVCHSVLTDRLVQTLVW